MIEDKAQLRAWLDGWLRDGSKEALDGLMNRFSASYHKHDEDGLIAFKEFLLDLVTPEQNQSEKESTPPLEPPIDFTGCVSEDRETEW